MQSQSTDQPVNEAAPLRMELYFVHDGVPSMRDSDLIASFDRMVAEGHGEALNFEGRLPDAAAFVVAVKTAAVFFRVWWRERMAAVVWLNRYEHRRAHFHFCVFNAIRHRERVAMGMAVNRWLLGLRRADGVLLVDVLWGVVPRRNWLAVDYLTRCGARRVGPVPNYVWNDALGCSEDGVLLTFTRGDAA